MTRRLSLRLAILVFAGLSAVLEAQTNFPSLDDVLKAKQDLWGLAAMREPNGPSYEFFERLLPPLRYVNAEFKQYPIALSAPNAPIKARVISDGSSVNARAGLRTWREAGVPVTFYVGEEQELFGKDLKKLVGPQMEKGYLPIVKFNYEHLDSVVEEEVFAAAGSGTSSDGISFKDHALVYVKFALKKGASDRVTAVIGTTNELVRAGDTICISNDQAVVWFDKKWNWDPTRKKLTANLSREQSALLAIPAKPFRTNSKLQINAGIYKRERNSTIAVWQTLLDRSAQLEVPEPLINNAYRALLANNFTLLKSDRANYSAGNQYERLYQAECGDVARAFLLWGYGPDSLPMLSHQFDYNRNKLEFHNAGFKLQQFAHYYWVTRDTNGFTALRPKWEKEITRVVDGREKDSGLFPKEQYCGDIFDLVYSLNPNANCWRGLRDFAAVLDDIGEKGEAQRLSGIAKEFRAAILKAVAQSEDKSTKPPFIPMMFFGQEKAYAELTESKLSSYWCLLAPYVIGSGVFGPMGSERERWMVDYFQEHGGICMGMVRFHQHTGLFANEDAVDDLYGLRYSVKLLELDEVDRALVSFYGKLAQGLTRDTFLGGEATACVRWMPTGDPCTSRPIARPRPTSFGCFATCWCKIWT